MKRSMILDKKAAINFIKENARPVDLAVFEYFFEGKENKNVVEELRKYQNEDGGFGRGLEADCWNPNSSPIATNDALLTLYKTKAFDEAEDMINGILKYLYSHEAFDEEKKCWQFAIESNKDYPHAIWWEKNGDGVSGYNPTASLAAFVLCFGKRDAFYESMIKDSFQYLLETEELGADALKCFLLSYSFLKEKGIEDVVDLNAFRELIMSRIESSICKDTSKYGKEYVPLPSDFFAGMFEEFMTDSIKELAKAEIEVLDKLQLEDGGFDISWDWCTEYKEEFKKARDMWRPKLTIDKLLFSQASENF